MIMKFITKQLTTSNDDPGLSTCIFISYEDGDVRHPSFRDIILQSIGDPPYGISKYKALVDKVYVSLSKDDEDKSAAR